MSKLILFIALSSLILLSACTATSLPAETLDIRNNITKLCPILDDYTYSTVANNLVTLINIQPRLFQKTCFITDTKIYFLAAGNPQFKGRSFAIYTIDQTNKQIEQTATWQIEQANQNFIPPTQINQQDSHSFELIGTAQNNNICEDAVYVYETTINKIILVNQSEVKCPQ